MSPDEKTISQINTIISDLADEHTHDQVRHQLLHVITNSTGFEFAMLAEMQPDGEHMVVTAIQEKLNLKSKIEKILGYPLDGYQFKVDTEYQLTTPLIEVFEHVSDFHDPIPHLVGSAIGKLMGIKKIVAIRQHTGEQYLGTATFATTSEQPDIDLLVYLCNNHLVYALRLINEQRERARIRIAHTAELEERVNERTKELEAALQQAYAVEEKISELYLILDRTHQVAEERLQETESLLEVMRALETAASVEKIFDSTLTALKGILAYEDALVISEVQPGNLETLAATTDKYKDTTWQSDDHFKQVFSGRTSATFDTSLIPEWQTQPSNILQAAVSALHIPLVTTNTSAMLICVHRQRGFFTKKHIELAERFSVLARQALSKAELFYALEQEKGRLEQAVAERTAELVALNQELSHENAERRLAEEVARESENNYRSLFESTNDAVFFIGLDDVHLAANQQAADMLGYELDEMIGMPVQAIIVSQEYAGADRVKKLLLDGKSVPVYQRTFRKKDGTEFPVEINAALIKDINNQPLHIQSVVRDITARREAEQQIRLQASALGAAASGISISDRDGTIVWVNPAFTQMTGYAFEEVIGKNHRILKSKVHDLSFFKNLWETISAGEIWQGEIINQRKDGTTYDEGMIITPVKNQKDEITHFIAIKQDISERKKAEKEIENLAKFPAENPDPILRVTRDGEILYANLGSLPLLQAWDVSLGENLPAYIFDTFRNHPDREGLKIKIEYPVDDQVFQLSFAPIGGTDYINIYGQNITEAKLADQMKAEFVASVSHELRTPLAAILGYTEILLDEEPGGLNEIQSEFMQIINESSQHLHMLVNDLLDVTKMEAGRFQLNYSKTNIELVLQKALRHIQPLAAVKGISLSTNLPSSLPVINGDPARLEQVFINLLSNSVKFTPPKGEIGIRISQHDDQISFQVKDTGIGIPEEDLPKLFDRFYRAKNVVGANIEGTGLGLYISKAIVESHQGVIHVSSELGQGSCFEVVIPIFLDLD